MPRRRNCSCHAASGDKTNSRMNCGTRKLRLSVAARTLQIPMEAGSAPCAPICQASLAGGLCCKTTSNAYITDQK